MSCEYEDDVFASLGQTAVVGVIGSCTLTAATDESLRVVLTLVTSTGERVNLNEDIYTVVAGGQETFNVSIDAWDPDAGFFSVELSAHDRYGRELEHISESVVARESGWNIGISSLSADGDITIGIQRTGYTVLANAVCELSVEAEGGWSTTYIVDIAYAEYAPVIFIENPNSIERDEKVTATLACSVPFDIDDDPEDDTQSTYYKSESLLTVSSNDVGWIVGVAGLVLVVAWLLGAIQAPKPQSSKPSTRKQEAKTKVTQEEQTPTAPESLDDIQLQTVEDETPSEPEPSVDEDMVIESTIEVIESMEEAPLDTTDATASGRLASLREEIGTDGAPEREGSIEDRMKKFFGNE